jgi:HAD superfamily phosphoserine phosphatase-like hydrolase
MKLALFDFDGTLFPLETIPYLVKEYYKYGSHKNRVIGFYIKTIMQLFRYKVLKQIDKVTFRKKVVRYFMDFFHGERKETINTFFHKVGLDIRGLLDNIILNEVDLARSNGYHTVILSGCFSELLEAIAPAISIDSVIGTQLTYVMDEKGTEIYDRTIDIDIIADERKVRAIKEAFPEADWEKSCAYADSCYDEMLLNLVGTKIAVNPDRILTSIAQSKNWKILITK